MTLATTVAPAVGWPPAGRGGPGFSHGDYHSVGIEFGQRCARLEEAVRTLRVLWGQDPEPFTGRFYSTDGTESIWVPPNAEFTARKPSQEHDGVA
jgi:alkanesulfonate monooxygenase SsuD/methylene tetrahydromethanopterin reductase-like flavin-dependent oxidoreductase (luciferase family)